MPAEISYRRRVAYFFSSERNELQQCLQMELKNEQQNAHYLLYGLWTHSSSVVIHLVLSTAAEIQLAETHKLNCLGYTAREYTKDLENSIRLRHPNMSPRESIRIEWNKPKQGGILRVFSWPTSVNDSQRRSTDFEVKILSHASPFRHLIPRHHTSIIDNIPCNIESETTKCSSQGSSCKQEDGRSVQGNPKPVSSQGNGEVPLASKAIIKSIQRRVEMELADDQTVKTKTNSELGVVQLEFTHHSRQWWIKLERDTRALQHVAVEIYYGTESGPGWEQTAFEELPVSSKNIISAIKSTCDVCDAKD